VFIVKTVGLFVFKTFRWTLFNEANYIFSEIDICESIQPCLNNGTCVSNKNLQLGYTCVCQGDYFGEICGQKKIVTKNQELHICEEKNPCLNQAKCSKSSNLTEIDYVCSCTEGYTGVNCETGIKAFYM
jgi:hypothetical protein